MNELIEFLTKHYHPGGSVCKWARVSDILKQTDYNIEQVFDWAMEARKEGLAEIARARVKDGRYGVDAMIPEDLDFVTVTRKGIAWHKENGAMQLHRGIH